MASGKLSVLFLIIIVIPLASCAKSHPRVAVSGDAGIKTTASRALERRIERHVEETSSLKAFGWILIGDGEEERQTDAAVVISRPTKIRVDAMDALADVWAEAGTDGKAMWLNLPSRSKSYSGRASKENLHRLTKFDFEISELLDVLVGSPPITGDIDIVQVGGVRDFHFHQVRSNLHMWTEKGSGRIERVVRFGDDASGIALTVNFAEYRRVGGVDFPHRIEAIFPSRGARIVVVYKDVELGGNLPPDAFLPR